MRLTNDTLAVFSPIALTPSVRTHLSTTFPNAPISYIVALDYEHHIHLSSWHEAYPSAHVIGPEGLPEKRAKIADQAKVPFHSVFKRPVPSTTTSASPTAPLADDAAFNADFDIEYVHAHANKELVFFYKPDRTLITADLFFNLPPTEQYSRMPPKGQAMTSILNRLFGTVMSTSGTAIWNRRFLWYVASSQDRPAFNASIQRINKWDIQRMIPCHGDVVESNAKGVFQKVFAWHLQGIKGGNAD